MEHERFISSGEHITRNGLISPFMSCKTVINIVDPASSCNALSYYLELQIRDEGMRDLIDICVSPSLGAIRRDDITNRGLGKSIIIFCPEAGCIFESGIPNSLLNLLLTRNHPPIVVFSECRDQQHIIKLTRMGISGYITPDLAPALILRALYLISAGGVFIPPNNIHLIDHESNEGESRALPDEQIPLSVDHLTPRERQVVRLLRTGRSNKIIAKELALQESTVKVHIKNIMDKLNAENRTHAVFLVNNGSNLF